MKVKFALQSILVIRKLIIEVLLMTYRLRIGFNVFYVIMKRVPIITNVNRPIYQTFN